MLRTCADRLVGDGQHTITATMRGEKAKATHQVEVRDDKGEVTTTTVEVKHRRLRVRPPIGKQKKYPELTLTVIHAREPGLPKGRERLDWKLVTNLPVRSRKEALEKLAWYAMRCQIETFHKVLRSGCRAEASKLRTADRITKLIAVFCILSCRIFWMTMMNPVAPDAPEAIALTSVETRVLDLLIGADRMQDCQQPPLSRYLTKIARLGATSPARRTGAGQNRHVARPIQADRH